MTHKYSYKADVWSLGVILFEMLSGGVHPFLVEGTTYAEYMISLPSLQPRQLPDSVSAECRALVSRLLAKDRRDRPTVREVIREPIVMAKVRLIAEEYVYGEEIGDSVRQQLIDMNLLVTPTPLLIPVPPPATPTPANRFSEALLEKLMLAFSTPQPEPLNGEGQSKLAECVRRHGWWRSVEELNGEMDTIREVRWEKFEGAKGLKEGIYYGQMLDGVRDGYGIVFCLDECNLPLLYECHWKGGAPFNSGRLTSITACNTYLQLDCTFTHSFHPSTVVHRETQYSPGEGGEWYKGECVGQEVRHGWGRLTKAGGEYQEGLWVEGRQSGAHAHYTKDGELIGQVYIFANAKGDRGSTKSTTFLSRNSYDEIHFALYKRTYFHTHFGKQIEFE
ncbi:hypothetical protein FGO68_gene11763 [Halteria grandinella]|uniref:non-specific serine/threonine protein kinase n=1 Tax=Halteria grandinella TaxID=5974 RepID=A0A8J8NUI1_HALGN|nr:hypothetical protein FGO68_gene11763 [Halteria grandinella]